MPIVIANPSIVVPVTWDATFDPVDLLLTNNDLTAEDSPTAVGTRAVAKATTFKTTGKWYYEVKVHELTGINIGVQFYVGWTDSLSSNNTEVGFDVNSASIGSNGAFAINNNYTGGGIPWNSPFVADTIISVLMDIDADETTWKINDGSVMNKSTPYGGKSVTPSVTSRTLPTDATFNANWTASFAPGDMTYVIPAGYSAWDS
jgi:hypothetical protein